MHERTGLVPLSGLLPAPTTSGVSSNFSACLQSWDRGSALYLHQLIDFPYPPCLVAVMGSPLYLGGHGGSESGWQLPEVTHRGPSRDLSPDLNSWSTEHLFDHGPASCLVGVSGGHGLPPTNILVFGSQMPKRCPLLVTWPPLPIGPFSSLPSKPRSPSPTLIFMYLSWVDFACIFPTFSS